MDETAPPQDTVDPEAGAPLINVVPAGPFPEEVMGDGTDDGVGQSVLRLEGNADIMAAQRLWIAAGEHAAACGDVLVDCSSLGRIDGAGAQILLALKKTLASRGRCLRLQSVPERAFGMLLQSGVGEALIERTEWQRGAQSEPAGPPQVQQSVSPPQTTPLEPNPLGEDSPELSLPLHGDIETDALPTRSE
jgi:ABC-type transporter Mla MlaB component